MIDPMLWVGKTVLVYGDPGIDHYVWGEAYRLSPEAPVPVFTPLTNESRSGLADNVVSQLSVLGINVRTHFPEKPWTKKTRYMVGNHQLLRVDEDRISFGPVDPPDLEGVDAVVISDYAKGWVNPNTCRELISNARKHGISVIVDPKTPDWTHFQGATVICPNLKEFENAEEAWRFPTIAIKCGPDGIILQNDRGRRRFPAKAQAVFDVTGAGDTVVSVIAASLASGQALEDAIEAANLAAGVVVGKVGTSLCPLATLTELLK